MSESAPSKSLYPDASSRLVHLRDTLAPGPRQAFRDFGKAAFAEGALDRRSKQLIAVAVAHVTQCPYCIRGHTKAALQAGATREQIMEAIWVASEMKAGAVYAHSLLALDEMPDNPA